MNKTQIEWVKNPDGSQGYTWNPITGCLNGCEYCYARKLANTRLRERYLANKNWDTRTPKGYEGYPNLDPFYPRFWEDRYLDFTTKRIRHHNRGRRGIFVCDMSDLFGIGIPEQWTRKVLEATQYYPKDRFYLLTKQPQNLIKFSPFPDNCWVGVTATDAKSFLEAGRGLEQIQAQVKYISFEPLLGYVGGLWLEDWLKSGVGINWVIIGALTFRGGVSGSYPQLTPMTYGNRDTLQPKIEWVEEIVRACDKTGIPVFLKDNLKPLIEPLGLVNGEWAAKEWVMCKYPVLRQEMPL